MISKIGVIGAGQMGAGIAHVSALAGYMVALNDISADKIESGMATINGNLSRQAASGKISKADMDKIRDVSEAFKKGLGPWVDWEDQMQLKSVVKRASKWWPKSTPRLAKALQILNEENGEGLAVLSKDMATVGMLPPPPSRDEVPLTVQNTVKQLVDRAVKQNAFEACRELMESRIKNPAELSFAYSELDKAKAQSEAKMHEQKIVNA